MRTINAYKDHSNTLVVNANLATHDPVVLLHWLREQGIVRAPYYLHIYQGCIEIGWQAKAHIAVLNGETDIDDWVSTLKQLGDQAAADNNKAFGYIGFDAWDSKQGLAPDHSAHFPLVQFFIPEHKINIENGKIHYSGPDSCLLEHILQAPKALFSSLLRPSHSDIGFSEKDFIASVASVKTAFSSHLTKVVLSRYLGFGYDADLLSLFSDYCLQQKYADAILMDFGRVGAAIATPELLVKIDNGQITANPLAGTKTRSLNTDENQRLATELLSDRKELAEHTLALVQMLKELQPNCVPGSLVVNRLLDIVQQNEIMHLSSELRGHLAADKHCIDAMLSLFPSAMVSGVPKAEAIQLIRQLEGFPRGLFGGTVGWVSGRDCRFGLTIRGIYKYGQRLFVQAGAGVMAESNPAQENEEVRMKMSAMLKTLEGNTSQLACHVG